MSKDRIEPCMYYICVGECEKGRNAEYSGYCQKCNKYVPRVRRKHQNMKREKLEKIRIKERSEYDD